MFITTMAVHIKNGNKIVGIVDAPMVQNIYVEGWYMQSFVDNNSVVMTTIQNDHTIVPCI
jgi:hypothetical protein